MHYLGATGLGDRLRRLLPMAGVVAAVVAVAACTVPVTPSPGVTEPAAGRGKDASVEVAPSGGCEAGGAGLPVGQSTITVSVGGVQRRSILQVPPRTDSGQPPRPLLVSLHPFLFDAPTWEAYSHLAAAAVDRGYVVLTPFGSKPGPRWSVPGGIATGVDDIAFIGAVIDLVEDTGCIDRNREFSAGFSAGAAMAQALSCVMPWRFAAVAGSGGVNLTSLCPGSPGTGVLVLHGTRDPIVPASGSTVPFAPPTGLSVASVVATDAARAGCEPDPHVSFPLLSVRRVTYQGCTLGRRVRALYLIGAGHTWAGSPNPLLELFTGPTNTDLSATNAMLDFFDNA